jgi:urea transporter
MKKKSFKYQVLSKIYLILIAGIVLGFNIAGVIMLNPVSTFKMLVTTALSYIFVLVVCGLVLQIKQYNILKRTDLADDEKIACAKFEKIQEATFSYAIGFIAVIVGLVYECKFNNDIVAGIGAVIAFLLAFYFSTIFTLINSIKNKNPEYYKLFMKEK